MCAACVQGPGMQCSIVSKSVVSKTQDPGVIIVLCPMPRYCVCVLQINLASHIHS